MLLHFCTIHAISITWFWVGPLWFSVFQLTYWSRAVMKGVCCFASVSSSSSQSSVTSGSTLALFRNPLDPSSPPNLLHPWPWPPHPLTAGRVVSFLKEGYMTALCLCRSASPALCEEGVGLLDWVYGNWVPATEHKWHKNIKLIFSINLRSNFEGQTDSYIVTKYWNWNCIIYPIIECYIFTRSWNRLLSSRFIGLVILFMSPPIKDMIGWRSSSILASFPAYHACMRMRLLAFVFMYIVKSS